MNSFAQYFLGSFFFTNLFWIMSYIGTDREKRLCFIVWYDYDLHETINSIYIISIFLHKNSYINTHIR
jgi:hypothetical protein